ncbi:hydroxyacylglutathione hydrolase [Rickettsiales bacterium LUAb2]
MITSQYFFIKILQDNYTWLLVNGKQAIAIDCGDATSLYDFVKQNNLNLQYILVTHHHNDHCQGLATIKSLVNPKIIISESTLARLKLDIMFDQILNKEQELDLLGFNLKVLFTKGHTDDHIVFYETNNKWLFSGDTLFSLGCGRIFEGDKQNLKLSLDKIKQLPAETLIFPGHEYTYNNLAFVNSLGYFSSPSNINSNEFNEYSKLIEQKHVEGKNTVPCLLSEELKFNPFLRANDQQFKNYMNKSELSDIDFFIYLRNLKDQF